MVALIASVGERGEIGRGGDLCWHLPEDLRRFKQLTMGRPVVMGRNTWESLPRRPLPGRLNIVVTSRPGVPEGDDMAVVSTLQEALEKGAETSEEIYVIGGAAIYGAAMPMADRLELTRILAADPGADTYFPEIEEDDWRLVERSEEMTSAKGERYRYETYERSRR